MKQKSFQDKTISEVSESTEAKKQVPSSISNIKEILKDRTQLGFLIIAIFATLVFVPFTYYGGLYVQQISNAKPQDYDFPMMADFKFCFVLSAVYAFSMHSLAVNLQCLFRGCAKDKDNKEQYDLRCKKSGTELAKLIYKIIASSFGFYVLRYTEQLPYCLGGSGDYRLLWKGHPYPEHVPYLKEYYLSCMSYHLAMFISTIIYEKKSDFATMMLHHSVTVYLMFGSYMFNIWECGAIIAFLHDVSDISAHAAKMWGNTTKLIFALPSVISTLLSWFYCRCLVLPYCVYCVYVQGRAQNLFDAQGVCLPIYAFLLSCLVVLHYYWVAITAKIIINAVFYNKTDDIADRVSIAKDKEQSGDKKQK